VELLEGLDDAVARSLLAGSVRRRFARREVLFHAGDLAESLHLLQRGQVAVRVTTDLGDVVTLDVFGPGQVLGELALLPPPGRRAASAVALDQVETMMVSAEAFHTLREANPSVNDALLGILANRNRQLNARLAEALYVPVESRVARRLLDVAVHYGAPRAQPVVVALTQDDLAGLAGTTRESVNRILSRLQSEGALEVRRGAVTIVDISALEHLAH
jgi:CRP/FNR family cyclic AMP-dependent transcriptional regulator